MSHFVSQIAPERFAKYLLLAQGNTQLAEDIYNANLDLAESLYIPIHTLEICLKNCVDIEMVRVFGPNWLQDPTVVQSPHMRMMVTESLRKLSPLGLRATRGNLVADLSFGFWSGMFGKGQRHLWNPHLYALFPAHARLQRTHIAQRLDGIRHLRNRVAHYEPLIPHITHINRTYSDMEEIIRWLHPDAATWLRQRSHFSATYTHVLSLLP